MTAAVRKEFVQNSDVIKILELSDVHLGHPNTPTQKILMTLYKIFAETLENSQLNLIIIAGDFFDHELNLSDDEVHDIIIFIMHLLKLCKKYNIVLLVLEGTPSHDWKQSRLFIQLNKVADINTDVRYYEQLAIDRIPSLNLDILLIPDEWKTTSEETWLEVKEKLAQHNLDKVDLTIMHGAFHHQMPEILRDRLDIHLAENYLSITRYYVFIGHVHFFSQYKNILSSGSVERLAHGEEGPKGYLRVDIDRVNNQNSIRFIENKEAMIYKTIDCTGLSLEDSIVRIESAIPRTPMVMHIRIACNKGDAALEVFSHLGAKYPNINWKVKDTGLKKAKLVVAQNKTLVPRGIQITPSNIQELLIDRIKLKHPLLVGRCKTLLAEVLDE